MAPRERGRDRFEDLKTGAVEFVGRRNRETGTRAGYVEVIKWALAQGYTEYETNAALVELTRKSGPQKTGLLKHHMETKPGDPAQGGAMYEETYELPGSSSAPKYPQQAT